jgi:hypothetical protein
MLNNTPIANVIKGTHLCKREEKERNYQFCHHNKKHRVNSANERIQQLLSRVLMHVHGIANV